MKKLDKLVRIGSGNIAVKEYRGQRVVTFKEIDECHGKQPGAARKRFNENKQHFIDGTDFFEISHSDVGDDFGQTYGFNVKAPKGIIITESGYLMLVKSFTDDLAWDVQRQLVNTYFRKGQADESLKIQIQQERAQAMLLNAKARVFGQLVRAGKDKGLSTLAAQVYGITTLENLTGQKISYRPECGKLYSATEIAREVGSNRITVGKRATAAGLKIGKYGMTLLSKSEYSQKQVPQFMYNEAGREAVKALFKA